MLTTPHHHQRGFSSMSFWKLFTLFLTLNHHHHHPKRGMMCLAQDTTAPENDVCAMAIPLEIGDSVLNASTIGATPPDQFSVELVSCQGGQAFDETTRGVWHQFMGTGAQVQITTCSEETDWDHRITVYSGSTCNEKECMASSTESDPDCPYNISRSLEFTTQDGKTYFLLVHDRYAGSSGTFGLQLMDKTPLPENDSCEMAVELLDNVVLQGTTMGATLNGGLWCSRCPEGGPLYPGVFYYIPATNNNNDAPATTNVTISTCSRNVNFDLSIYYGESCGNFMCFDQVETILGLTCPNGGVGSMVTWLPQPGQNYYIYVHPVEEVKSSSSAAFGIRLDRSTTSNNQVHKETTSGAFATDILTSLGIGTCLLNLALIGSYIFD